jgi:glyoxalase family protein
MTHLEVGGLQHTSSINRDAAKYAGFYSGVLGMRLVYRIGNFDHPSMHHLAYADSASSTSREEGPTQEELAAVRHLGRRVAQNAALPVGGRAHTFRKGGSR